MSARDDYRSGRCKAPGVHLWDEQYEAMCDEIDRLREALDPPFPPHNPDYPDVNPATGDERETTTGRATP